MTSPADWVARYEAGESILSLATEADCAVTSMRLLLVNAGAVIRTRGGARELVR